jgi:cobalt/nickel transport system permease protein
MDWMKENDRDITGSVPAWLRAEEAYEPSKDRDAFSRKSIIRLMSVLSKVRNSRSTDAKGARAPFKIAYTVYFILLIACAKNMFFCYCMLAGILLRYTFLPERELKRSFFSALVAAIFGAFLLLPAVFLGSPRTCLTVAGKVFLSVSLVNFLASTTPWNRITEGFRFFHVPDIFILTLDLTLKYIVLLGDVSLAMLESLTLRSVGKNRQKGGAVSGVLGVTFLKSRALSEEQYGAMQCRGFEGTYERPGRFVFSKKDIWYIILIVAVTALFIYLEGAM